MGIYNSENLRYIYIECRNCHYQGEIIDVLSGLGKSVCPACGGQVQNVRSLDATPCEETL